MYKLTFSPDGGRWLLVSYDRTTLVHTARLWDTASGRLKAVLNDADLAIFSPDSRTVATDSDASSSAYLWDAASGQLKATLKDVQSAYNPEDAFFSPDSQTLVTQSYARRGAPLRALGRGQRPAQGDPAGCGWPALLAFSPDSKTLATGTSASLTVRLWDVASGQLEGDPEGRSYGGSRWSSSPSPPMARRW